MDKHNSVIFIGSFSKLLPTGLRLGWIVVPLNLTDLFLDVNARHTAPANILTQLVVDDLMATGGLRKYVSNVNNYLAHTDRFTEEILRKYLGKYADWRTNAHPLVFWVKFKKLMDTYAISKLNIVPDTIFGQVNHAMIGKVWHSEEEFEKRCFLITKQLKSI